MRLSTKQKFRLLYLALSATSSFSAAWIFHGKSEMQSVLAWSSVTFFTLFILGIRAGVFRVRLPFLGKQKSLSGDFSDSSTPQAYEMKPSQEIIIGRLGEHVEEIAFRTKLLAKAYATASRRGVLNRERGPLAQIATDLTGRGVVATQEIIRLVEQRAAEYPETLSNELLPILTDIQSLCGQLEKIVTSLAKEPEAENTPPQENETSRTRKSTFSPSIFKTKPSKRKPA